EVSLHCGETAPQWQGWSCRQMGEYLPAPALVISGSAEVPIEICNLFYDIKELPEPICYDPAAGQVRIAETLLASWRWEGERFHWSLNELWK
ncbi:MAG: hypothetical protein ABH878_08055, partial [bacterium]